MSDHPQPIPNLSFARQDSKGKAVDYWQPTETGDWSQDNETGRKYAEELRARMQSDGAPILLPYVVQQIVARGKFGGVETGFFTAIGAMILN